MSFSFRTYFVFRSVFPRSIIACAALPCLTPPLLSLSFRPSRPAAAVGRAGCLSDSSSSDEERQALALAAAPQLARVQLMTCSHVLLACRSGASSGTSTPRLARSAGLVVRAAGVLCAANGLETYFPSRQAAAAAAALLKAR